MLNKCGVMRRISVRALTIKQAPQVSTSSSVLNNSINNAKNIENVEALPNLKTMGSVKMEAVGIPPSAMTIGVPPSLPVYVRRRTLLTIQGKHENITASSETIQFLKRFVLGNFVSRYQKLIGTEPFSLMVTSNPLTVFPSLFRNGTSKSFASIKLDGINDWALLKSDALHAYSGPSININMYRLPKKISSQLSRRLKLSTKELTGLFHWARSGFTFVTGRGSIGLVGNGVIYSVNIAEGEELSINRNSLVAISVNGPYDLQNCVVKYTHPMSNRDREVVIFPPPPKIAQIRTLSELVTNVKYYWSKVLSLFQKFGRQPSNVLVGQLEFVRVIGPRSVLVQSGSPYQSFERNFLLPKFGVSKFQTPERTPSDFLNVVSIDPKEGPSISSVTDFKDAVRNIEKRN